MRLVGLNSKDELQQQGLTSQQQLAGLYLDEHVSSQEFGFLGSRVLGI
jgi:hypothetical protein